MFKSKKPVCRSVCVFGTELLSRRQRSFAKVLSYSFYLWHKEIASMDNKVCGVLLLFVFGGQPFYFRRVREIVTEPSLSNSQRLFCFSCSRLLQGKVETIGFHMAFKK